MNIKPKTRLKVVEADGGGVDQCDGCYFAVQPRDCELRLDVCLPYDGHDRRLMIFKEVKPNGD